MCDIVAISIRASSQLRVGLVRVVGTNTGRGDNGWRRALCLCDDIIGIAFIVIARRALSSPQAPALKQEAHYKASSSPDITHSMKILW